VAFVGTDLPEWLAAFASPPPTGWAAKARLAESARATAAMANPGRRRMVVVTMSVLPVRSEEPVPRITPLGRRR
jgi:hypothetical protein